MKPKNIPTKIMLVLESWGQGGTETYVAGLIKVLLAHRYEIQLVLLRGSGKVNIEGLSSEKIHVMGLSGLAKGLSNDRPDILSLHLYTSLLPVTILGKLFSIPVASTLHMPYSAWGMRHRFYWWVAARLSDKVVGVTKEVFNGLYVKNLYTKPIPGGVDPAFFKAKRKPKLVSDPFSVLAMGRLSKEKDWPTLIRAVGEMPVGIRRKITLDFYGNGPLRNELKSLALKEGVKVRFHGHVEKKELIYALAKTNLSVLPSRFEGLGLSALEGMAVGVPTITADFMASKMYIENGVTGNSFPIGDSRALADLILWHMGNPTRSSKLGAAGKKLVQKKFSEEYVFIDYLDVFDSLLKRKIIPLSIK